jgi:hypothetical protein
VSKEVCVEVMDLVAILDRFKLITCVAIPQIRAMESISEYTKSEVNAIDSL